MAAQDTAEQLLHLKLAFLAGEPPASVLSLARKAGEGSITPHVQHFLLENCTSTNVEGRQNCTYTTTILKRIIAEIELSSGIVIDELYEEFAQRMLSKAKDPLLNKADYIYKEISFLPSSDDNTSPGLVSMVARLSCSSNMLEGDTGCSLWPSSLFLSEFILSYPKIFSKKCCLEQLVLIACTPSSGTAAAVKALVAAAAQGDALGSGVGLVGICLNHIAASKVILTDGDSSTLTNMKENMELNNLCVGGEHPKLLDERTNKVECKYLSWEEVSESDLGGCQPDIVLGADIIYDPICVPHLVRVLSTMLRRDGYQGKTNGTSSDEFVTEGPIAYIAIVVRNVDTFNCFGKAAADAKLSVVNITSNAAPANFLPYMLSYDRSSVQLLRITSSS